MTVRTLEQASLAGDYGNGLHVEYLPANQAYLVMWLGQRLAGPMPAREARDYLRDTMGVSL